MLLPPLLLGELNEGDELRLGADILPPLDGADILPPLDGVVDLLLFIVFPLL
jgi:hypothetical protein